jgi:hypothetical protein
LQFLGLSDNLLTTLPPEIGQLVSLQNMHLFNNRLANLPPEMGRLANLTYIDLFANDATLACLPRSLIRLPIYLSYIPACSYYTAEAFITYRTAQKGACDGFGTSICYMTQFWPFK